MAILTRSVYKALTGIPTADTSYDSLLDDIIAVAEAFAARYLGWDSLEADDYTETYDGNGDRTIWLRHWPANTVTSVSYVDSAGTATAYAASDYIVNSMDGALHRASTGHDHGLYSPATFADRTGLPTRAHWPDGHQNIRVVYNGGYTTAPDDLVHLVVQLVDSLLATRRKDLIEAASSSLGGESVVFKSVVERDATLRSMFAGFRRFP